VPVASAVVRGKRIRIWDACEISRGSAEAPGELAATTPEGIEVAAGSGAVRILKLQLPGKNPVSARDFLNANPTWRSSAGRAD
jgi:methionyl-tRNA formyltransferase